MDNEDINFHMGKKWYDIAKQLDPTRFVNTADGVCCSEGPLNEKTDSSGPAGPVDRFLDSASTFTYLQDVQENIVWDL